MEHVSAKDRVAGDLHSDLILLWNALQNGWEPPSEVSEELYNSLKKAESSALRGFVGFGCSNSGKWFGGYARDKTTRNYAKNAFNGLMKKLTNLKDVSFYHGKYDSLKPEGAIIYCDPPYSKTTGFSVGSFNSDEFWDWVRIASLQNEVYVSEYSAPADFEVVWEKAVKTDMKDAAKNHIPRIEKLFKLNPKVFQDYAV